MRSTLIPALAALVVLVTPVASLADEGEGEGSSGIFDWGWTEPYLGLRSDVGQANASGFAIGPLGGIKAGLFNGNVFAAVDLNLGLLAGFPSLAYPLDIGILIGGRPSALSVYRFSVGLGTEKIYGARTPQGLAFPFAGKIKLEAERVAVSGPAYGIDLGVITFSEDLPAQNFSYTSFTASFFISFPSHTDL